MDHNEQTQTILAAIQQKLKELLQNKKAEIRAFPYSNASRNSIFTDPQDNYAYIWINWAFNYLYLDRTEIKHKATTYITIDDPKVVITTYEWTDPQLLEKLEAIINTIPNK